MDSSSQRIDLESKLAFLERTVETLNEVILEQGRSLEILKRRLDRIEGGLDQASGVEPRPSLQDERPPHY